MGRYELSEYKDRCAYWLEAVRSCRLCLFNTLCNLERNTAKENLHHKKDQNENKDTMWSIH